MKQWIVVSPSVADSRVTHTVNGNSRTAERWAQMLVASGAGAQVELHWAHSQADAMLALHARRSAPSIAAWARAHPSKPLVVVLTGTDLYRDIAVDAEAVESLRLASHLVVLQDEGIRALPEAFRHKARTIYQSATTPARQRSKADRLQALMVGHLRAEKDPATFMQAAVRLAGESAVELLQIGELLDAQYQPHIDAARSHNPRYRFLGAQPYAATLQAIANADVLVSCSRMEGGAHVIAEACRAGVPVLASRIDGNVGMLGQDYAGYFELGNAEALSAALAQLSRSPSAYSLLLQQCCQRAGLFEPAVELAALAQLNQDCFAKEAQ